MVVGVEVTHHQGVAAEVSFKEGGEVGREVGWAGASGGDVNVDYCNLDVVAGDLDPLMLSDGIRGEEGVGVEG